MSMTDPIADMLTRIRNAVTAAHPAVDMPASRTKEQVAKVLLEEGFISAYKVVEMAPQHLLRVHLKYGRAGEKVIRGIQRVSKPGRRVYRSVEELRPVLAGTGIAIVSTSRGVLSDRQCRGERVGGEVLCHVW